MDAWIDYGTCLMDDGYSDATDAATRWHCRCNDDMYEVDGTHWTVVKRATCQYIDWEVPGVRDWAVPLTYLNGNPVSLPPHQKGSCE
jgi:hypothetical protein